MQTASGGSGTPIYDALYSEYRRLFLTLPGDRSGEESLRFKGFAPWLEEHRSSSSGSSGPSESLGSPSRHGGNRGGRPATVPAARSDNRMHGGR